MILVNLVILMEVSEKPELPFIDVQGLDPMVEGGGWNAKLRRRARWPGDPASAFNERRFDDLSFAARLALNRDRRPLMLERC